MAWAFGNKGSAYRRMDLNRAALNAEWDVPPGRIGQLVRQQRRRALITETRTAWILMALIATIAMGLGYYIGLPIWGQLQDAAKRGHETEARLHTEELQAMDTDRDAVLTEIAEALQLTVSRLQPDFTLSDVADSAVAKGGRRVISVGRRGLAVMTEDGGMTWTRMNPRVLSVGDLSGSDLSQIEADPTGERLFILAQRNNLRLEGVWSLGSHTSVFSTNGGDSWDQSGGPPVLMTTGNAIFNTDLDAFVSRFSKPIRISKDYGRTWRHLVELDGGAGVNDFETRDGVTTAVGDGGFIAQSADKGMTWDVRDSGTEVDLKRLMIGFDDVMRADTGRQPDTGASVAVDSVDGGRTWAPGGDDAVMPEPIVIVEDDTPPDLQLGDARVRFGPAGQIQMLTETGEIESESTLETINEFAGIGATGLEGRRAVLAARDFRDRAQIVSTIDAGRTWRVTVADITDLAEFADRYVGSSGTDSIVPDANGFLLINAGVPILRVDDRFASLISADDIAPGLEGDQAVAAALAKLPAGVRSDETFAPLLDRYSEAIKGRAETLERLETANRLAAQIAGTGYSPGQQRDDYRQFLAVCRGAGEVPVAEDCTDAYIALRGIEEPNVWETIAERAPQAVLLLFLLATLGILYRYNVRITGFHHSRADALELVAVGRVSDDAPLSEAETKVLVQAADALASDKVEFGRVSNPSDQALALAQSILNRT